MKNFRNDFGHGETEAQDPEKEDACQIERGWSYLFETLDAGLHSQCAHGNSEQKAVDGVYGMNEILWQDME